MSKWDISPDGVRGVLARTQSAAADLEREAKSLNSALQGASTQSGSEIVAAAISAFAEAKTRDIRFVFARTGACLSGAAQATNAYLRGDLEMAANAQASATGAPDPRTTMPRGGSEPR